MKDTLDIPWRFERRLIQEQLGAQKYGKIGTAISELVSNSFDAGATKVEVILNENQLGAAESLTIRDNGCGISLDTVKNRFAAVGVQPDGSAGRFGRFGVGRFAVYRIGTLSEWESHSLNTEGKIDQVLFRLSEDSAEKLSVKTSVSPEDKTGTTVKIYNLSPHESDYFSARKITEDLLTQYMSYLIGRSNKEIFVNQERIDPKSMIKNQERETRTVTVEEKSYAVEISHLILNRSVLNQKFPSQFLMCSNGKFVASEDLEVVVPNNYLALVNSDYFDEIVSSNRESLVSLDSGYQKILNDARTGIETYIRKQSESAAKTFIEEARSERYYPFKDATPTPTKHVEQAIYDAVLEKINEKVDIAHLSKKHQAVIFKLLNRAMKNANIMDACILHSVL